MNLSLFAFIECPKVSLFQLRFSNRSVSIMVMMYYSQPSLPQVPLYCQHYIFAYICTINVSALELPWICICIMIILLFFLFLNVFNKSPFDLLIWTSCHHYIIIIVIIFNIIAMPVCYTCGFAHHASCISYY